MHTSIRSRRRRGERGAAAVEFALVLPLLLAFLFGIVAYGVVFAQSLSLSNSARQAARSGVIAGASCAQMESLAKDAADTIAMDGDDADVEISRGTSEGAASIITCGTGDPCIGQPEGTNLYVSLTYATADSGLQIPLIPIPTTLKGKGVFRCEL